MAAGRTVAAQHSGKSASRSSQTAAMAQEPATTTSSDQASTLPKASGANVNSASGPQRRTGSVHRMNAGRDATSAGVGWPLHEHRLLPG